MGGREIQKNRMRMDIIFWMFILFALLRLWLGQLVGIWFPAEQGYDDALMINYANLRAYFGGVDIRNAMLKEMGMPFVLQVVNISGIPYAGVLSLIWILNGALAAKLVYAFVKNRLLALGVYAFILFQPSAFDNWCGTRLYRAGLLNPLYLLVLLLAITILVKIMTGKVPGLLLVFGGAALSITYYIKEDGMWLLMTWLFLMVLWFAACLINRKQLLCERRWIRTVLKLGIPLLIFICVTVGYKGINYLSFGVFETNMRTKGETGRFVENIYRIEAPGKSERIWASKEAIEAAFDASPTLKAHPELKENLFHSQWVKGNIEENPYIGDYLGWALKDAMIDTGIAQTQAEKQAFFKAVNQELSEAFRNGSLQRDTERIHIVSSLGGYSVQALKQAVGDAFDLYRRHILLAGYIEGSRFRRNDPEFRMMYEQASVLTNMPLDAVETEIGIRYHEILKDLANRIINGLFWIYRILLPIAIAAATAGLVRGVCIGLKKAKGTGRAKNGLMVVLQAGLLGISFVYNYMVALFCIKYDGEFVAAEKMYSVGVVSLLCVYIVTGTALLFRSKESVCIEIDR